jgi:hypothetical protein
MMRFSGFTSRPRLTGFGSGDRCDHAASDVDGYLLFGQQHIVVLEDSRTCVAPIQ